MTSADPNKTPLRLAHFSDIHLTARPLGWRFRDLATKRMTGWLNLKLGRGRRFGHAGQLAAAMMADLRERGCQHVIFSGDATTLGFESELVAAASCLGVGDAVEASTNLPGLAVPGNHDYYIRSAAGSGRFEQLFARWQSGERLGPEIYPFAQRVGHCWLIGVNSAQSNFLVWDARGRMGAAQAQRLRALLKNLSGGPRILVTHYPLYLATGKPETRWRRLRDDRELLDISNEGGISLWLHGHRHTGYVLDRSAERPFPIICAGSATQSGRWSWNEYVIVGTRLTMVRRTWNPEAQRFADAETREIDLS
jgi:3',5'-cyclic AMP phosphodiesterase CpdA